MTNISIDDSFWELQLSMWRWFIPKKNEIKEIIDFFQNMYDSYKDDSEIELYNKNLRKKIAEEMEEKYQKTLKERKPYAKDWYVYFVQDSHWFVKIWWSKNPEKRLSKFITENSWKIELIHQIYCDDRFKRESEFHNMFSEKRMNWEWFDLSDSDINKILSIKK